MVALRQKNTRIVLLKRRLVRGVMFRVVITMIVLRKLARSRGNLDAMRCSQRTLYEVRPRKDHRGVDLISASHLPNLSAQFLPCSLLIGFPSQRQEIDCKMQSNSR